MKVHVKYGIGINHITMKYFTTGSATCAIIMESAKDFFASGFIVSIICSVVSFITNIITLVEHPDEEKTTVLLLGNAILHVYSISVTMCVGALFWKLTRSRDNGTQCSRVPFPHQIIHSIWDLSEGR